MNSAPKIRSTARGSKNRSGPYFCAEFADLFDEPVVSTRKKAGPAVRLVVPEAKPPFSTELLPAPASEPVGVGAWAEIEAVGVEPVPEVDASTVVLEPEVAAVTEVVPVGGAELPTEVLEPLVDVDADAVTDVEPATGVEAPTDVEALAVGVAEGTGVPGLDVDTETDAEVVGAVAATGAGVETVTLAEVGALPAGVPLVVTVPLTVTVVPVGVEIDDETPIGSSARAAEGPRMARMIAIPMTARTISPLGHDFPQARSWCLSTRSPAR